jgi:hypothetical protein
MINDIEDSSDDDCLYHFRKMHRQQRSENDAKKIQNRGEGSKVGKATNVNRFRAEYDKLLKDNYFGENLIYSPAHFRRRFPMSRSYLKRFLKIWLMRIHTLNRRKMPWVWSVFAASKVNLSTSNVGLQNFGRSAG